MRWDAPMKTARDVMGIVHPHQTMGAYRRAAVNAMGAPLLLGIHLPQRHHGGAVGYESVAGQTKG